MIRIALTCIAGVALGSLVVACDSKDPNTSTGAPLQQGPRAPTMDEAKAHQAENAKAIGVIKTNLGTIKVKFFPDLAPITVQNFVTLANKGFYDKTMFHRVIPGFMIQGGDPNTKPDSKGGQPGTGGPGYSIPAEFNSTSHKRGILSMARSSDPDSAGSQFFIVVKDSVFLDNKYTAFGEVVEGMDVADKIVNLKRDAGDMPLPANPAIIESITIELPKAAATGDTKTGG